jgi:hypothetical protein
MSKKRTTTPQPHNPITRALLLALALQALATTSACGGACQELQERYDDALRRETALAGTGISTLGGGEYHVGVTFSPELFRTVALEANSVFGVLTDRQPVSGESGRTETIRLSLIPTLDQIKFGSIENEERGRTEEVALVTFQFELTIDIRTPGRARTHQVFGWFTVSGHFQLDYDDFSATTALTLVFDRFDRDTIDLGPSGLRSAVAEVVAEWVHDKLDELLFEEIQQVALVRFPTLSSAALGVAFAPAGLVLYPEHGTVFIGFVTNLRPESGGRVVPVGEAPPESLRVQLHPALAEAGARLALAEGTMPRTFNRAGELDPDGEIQLSLDSLSFEGETVRLGFTAWDFGDAYCREVPMSAQGPIRIREDSIGLQLTDIEGGVDSALWLRSSFAVGMVEIAEEFIDVEGIHLASGRHQQLQPIAVTIDPGRVTIDLIPR